jgi:hypothetical protein
MFRKRLLVEVLISTDLIADFLELLFSNSLRIKISEIIWEGS